MMKLRVLISFVLIGCVSLFASCSYITDFVVVNDSDESLDVRYKVKLFPGPFAPPVTPTTIAISRLKTKGGQEWKELNAEEYNVDPESRSVTVKLGKHQALLVARMHHYIGHENAGDGEDFPIEELSVTGKHGLITLAGEQARIMFVETSKALYVLTYK